MTDVFIPTTIKDLNKVGLVVESILKHIDVPGTQNAIGDFYISMPNKGEAKDGEVAGHKVFLFNDLDVLPFVDLRKSKFRPNWVLQQLLKLLQDKTKTEYVFICDSDLVFIRDFKLFGEDGRPIQYLGKDDNQYYINFISKLTGGQVQREAGESYIADLDLFKKSILDDMLKRYNMSSQQFADFTFESTVYTGNNDTSCIISEYELYGNYCEHFFKGLYAKKQFSELDCGRSQDTQQKQIFTMEEMKSLVAGADASKYDAVKLQSSCFPSDLIWSRS